MELSSPRFKSFAVTLGTTFWFVIITTTLGIFSFEMLGIFVLSLVVITQIFAKKLAKGLDVFAIVNTKIFLGILFILIISIYGLLFKLLQIDPLRLKKHESTYWLNMEFKSFKTDQY